MPIVVSILPRERFQTANIVLPEGWNFKFLEKVSPEDIVSACQGADFLLVPPSSPLISARILEQVGSIRLVQSSGVGYDQIDITAAARLGIPVANAAGQNATTVAEFTIGLLIVLQRQVSVADREIKAGHYEQIRRKLLATGLREIRDIKLGLVGFGAIGCEVAKLARMLGAQVSYYKPSRLAENVEAELEVTYMPLDELLADSDVISMHVPLNEQTRGLFGQREFSLMCFGSLFINTARGEIVDQVALAEALESGRLGGAAIDTLSPEPPPSHHPLLHLSPTAQDKLLLTPHLGGVTAGAFGRLLRTALANMERVAAGKVPNNVVNRVLEARKAK